MIDGQDRHRPRVRPWIAFILAVIVAFFAMIYSRTSLDRSAFDLTELEAQIAEEEARHWDLRVEVARLQSPDRIAEKAESMGMIFPARRVALEVPGVDDEGLDPEYRWAQLKALLSATP
jgi:cell division protein FtsL